MISHAQYRRLIRFSMMLDMEFNEPEPCKKCGKILKQGDAYLSKDFLNCKVCDYPIDELRYPL